MLQSTRLKRVGHDLAIEQHIYMESRKMVLMYLFAGQEWRSRDRDRLMDTELEGKCRMN